jgi:hypothetical protein
MYPACMRSPVAAGLDGIRLSKVRRRDTQSTYRAVGSDNTWFCRKYQTETKKHRLSVCPMRRVHRIFQPKIACLPVVFSSALS